MKAIDSVKGKYGALSKEDMIHLSCPDVLLPNKIQIPTWCKEINRGSRIHDHGHSCRECWNRPISE